MRSTRRTDDDWLVKPSGSDLCAMVIGIAFAIVLWVCVGIGIGYWLWGAA